MVAFTPGGAELGTELANKLRGRGCMCTLAVPLSVARAVAGRFQMYNTGAQKLEFEVFTSLNDWTASMFKSSDALIFIGASGIAVRAIAPYVRDKFTDPAVLSVDELGDFVVPLLSGHAGGGNTLAREVSKLVGATAVISTGTDVKGIFAVDVWAGENGFAIGDRQAAKHISAALLRGEEVYFDSDFPVEGELPDGIHYLDKGGSKELGFCITLDSGKNLFQETLKLYPRIITLGIGCRRGIRAEEIEDAASNALADAGMPWVAVSQVASIDIKAEEEGLLEFCGKKKLGLTLYTAEQLGRVRGDFTASEFVMGVTGVDNVCERAAAASGGRLLLKKRRSGGVTVAVSAGPCTVRF